MKTQTNTGNAPIDKLWEQLSGFFQGIDPAILVGIGILFTALLIVLGVMKQRRSQRRPELAKSEKRAPSQSIKPTAPTIEPTIPGDVEEIRKTDDNTWVNRLRGGLSRTRSQISGNLIQLFSKKAPLDTNLLEEVHEVLFRADIGIQTADQLIDHLRTKFSKYDAPIWEDVQASLKDRMISMLEASNRAIARPSSGPFVILIVGVNGVGKTTSIGKLAAHFLAQDQKVLVAAGDTFRAAAIDQLQVWADRLGCDIVKHQQGSDPASVAFDAVKAAQTRKYDVVLIDTAGRLHNKKELMDELSKIRRVIQKDLPEAPHETWLVIDATTGQNAFQQIKAFSEATPLTGLIVTKLDGTAKGGVVIGASDQFKMPIRFVGVGEKAADLRPFLAKDFVESIF